MSIIVKQIGGDITEPIDDSAPQTTQIEKVYPKYGIASLNFAIDRYRQLCSKLTLFVFWSPKTLAVLIVANAGMISYQMGPDGSLSDLILHDIAESIRCLLFFMSSFACILLYCKLQSYFLKDISDEIEKTGADQIYNKNIYEFVNVSGNEKPLENALTLTHREIPIAVVAWKYHTAEKVEISLVGGRKVYMTSDFYEDMIEWAIQKITKRHTLKGIAIFTKCYSFDNMYKTAITAKKFTKKRSTKLGGILGNFYGVRNEEYSISL